MLAPTYEPFRRVRIDIEGLDRLPAEPVIFAMNHTDRYNYWPFQYRLWRTSGRFTATWVKGKYYEHPVVARFMELTNNLPTVSRGYLVARDFLNVLGRKPTEAEYMELRARVDAVAKNTARSSEATVPPALFRTPRDMLGRPFDPTRESWEDAILAVFKRMMTRFLALHDEAFALGLDLIIFPQGTRSVRLSRGHIGLAQIALAYQKTVVPVGCSGSDQVYPGSNPLPRRGHVVYRIGEPLRYADAADCHIEEPFVPFRAADEERHRPTFQRYVDRVMDRINGLVDPPYRFADEQESEGVEGVDRFV